ncbi:hypothetical protein RvVAR0630_pl07650 (plasmid) [Agrobacterium vitis]|uniref:hypothetical protein n=1 Tax=Agrobacterium vitis TaxID=373 RepID=UPI0015D897C8|nr:hypothetical protein [Agrobacterium vitis]BCH62623.1 hypothetical protein RvVAR0630_pl07650 [Agrobacterium vitis]
MASNDVNNHKICGDASVLIPPQFREQFGKHHNVTAPLLLCDTSIFKQTFRVMDDALPEAQWQYAMKTNDHPALIATAIQEGHGLDCSSLGEIQIVHDVATALSMDVAQVMARCSYGNTNKATGDIAKAYALGVRKFSLDDHQEIDKIAKVAPGAFVYLRTYLDATQATAISAFTNKFGAPLAALVALAVDAQNKGLKPYAVGLSVGGGQKDPEAFALGVETAATINKQCQDAGVPTMTGITFCGGLPASSAPGAPTFKAIGERIRSACTEFGIAPRDVTFEPGRSLGTTCGIIEAKVITLKKPKQGDGVWTLVLNVGVFKGLYEMERTNLTYKVAAYGTTISDKQVTTFGASDELVPCRIVDDTCDSKGVCFKESTIMMPKSLVEGSRVYFLDTGSYTTAYVMEGFNRTEGLISKCFPDPLAKAKLPAWLKNVPTPGEAAHPNTDFEALWTAYLKLQTDNERIRFLIKTVPGAATLGIPLLPAHLIKGFRKLNSAIIQHNPGQKGDERKTSFQPQTLFQDMWEGWVANSALHSATSWTDFSNVSCHGGATAYFCIQNQYRSTVNHCTLMHATLVIVPEDSADGPSKFIEVNYNPNAIEGLDKTVIEKTFGQALRNEFVYRDPQGDFEQLMAGVTLRPEFANPDLVWAGSFEQRDPLSVYWPKATAKGGVMRSIDLEGALVFNLDTKQHSRVSQLVNFLDASYIAGYGVSNRAHVDRNSCIVTTIRLLTLALLGKDKHFGEDWSTDQLMEHMANLAATRLWTHEKGHSILDLEKFKRAAKQVGVKEVVGNIQSILGHPTMMRPHGGENAYNTVYMSPVTVPHWNYHAQQLYGAAAHLAFKVHANNAFNMGAIAEQMEF